MDIESFELVKNILSNIEFDWKDLLSCFINIDNKQYEAIQNCKDRKELEGRVRELNIFNMND